MSPALSCAVGEGTTAMLEKKIEVGKARPDLTGGDAGKGTTSVVPIEDAVIAALAAEELRKN